MKKEKRKWDFAFLCFLALSLVYLALSILHFTDENSRQAFLFLCLGVSSFGLSLTHLHRGKKDKGQKG